MQLLPVPKRALFQDLIMGVKEPLLAVILAIPITISVAWLPTSMQVERREILGLAPVIGCSLTLAGLRTSFPSGPALTNNRIGQCFTIDEAVAWINESCGREFISAVVESDYRFLYRGIAPGEQPNSMLIRHEVPDLLSPATYEDPDACRFFAKLESSMSSCPLQPSTGHLGTSSCPDATQWGQAASIWPVRGTDFAWFEDKEPFFPRSIDNFENAGIICNGRNCGEDSLSDALAADHAEILFSANPFLSIPASHDKSLRRALQASFLI